MPTIPELVYAALLYKDGELPENPESKEFVRGTETENGKLIFSFQKPDDTSGTFTLEIFAFVKTEDEADEDTPQFSRGIALFSGKKEELEIVGDKIVIDKAISLSSNEPGTVSLKIKVPVGCSLEIDSTANFNCEKDEASSDTYALTQKDASGILTGAYKVNFTVKKGDEIIHIFSEYINVINGLCTDTWSGSEKGAAKDVTNSISKAVYVCGEGGWYDGSEYNETATVSDSNLGSLLSPLATIQKAIDKIIARNDGTSEYTIFVDGTLTATSSASLADFNGVSQALSVKIVSLSASNKAILNGNDTARCVTVGTVGEKKLNLTLENLVITNGNTTGRGGGIFFRGKTLEMTGCEVIGCEAQDGGGIYIYSVSTFKMKGGTISNCIAKNFGGGVYIDSSATFEMSGTAKVESNNDVYLFASGSNFATICIAGALTAATPVATITPSAYTANRQVLSAGDDVPITPDVCKQFELTPDPDGGEWKITLDSSGASGVLNTKTLYVRGSGAGWYADNEPGATASDSNSGAPLKPLATIQEAIDKIIAMNDGTGEYTIFVDGTLTQSAVSDDRGMANFYGRLAKDLTLTIKSRSETTKATLDANQKSSVISAYCSSGELNLTLEKLVIMNGNSDNKGGGIFVFYRSTVILTNCAIKSCEASSSGGGIHNEGGTVKIENSEFSDCTSGRGGGIYNVFGTITVSNCDFLRCEATLFGGGVYNSRDDNTIATIIDCSFTSCKTDGYGGGIYNGAEATLTISGVTYSNCTASVSNNLANYGTLNP